MSKVILWLILLAFLLDSAIAGYLISSCNYKFDLFTVGAGIVIQILVLRHWSKVERYQDLGHRIEATLLFLFIFSFGLYAFGFAWQTHLGKFTPYGFCAPKSVSDEAMESLIRK